MISLDDELESLYNVRFGLEDQAYILLCERRYHSLKLVMIDYLKVDNMIRGLENDRKDDVFPLPYWWITEKRGGD